MTKTLGFLHTSPVHVTTFNRLAAELCPEIPLAHVVNEDLLRVACAIGITDELEGRIGELLDQMTSAGAAVIVCTCSTIGECAERMAAAHKLPLVRLDRAMAEHAIALGPRIGVIATLASTLTPTRALLEQTARDAGVEVTIFEMLCADAWPVFEHGDLHAYYARIAHAAVSVSPLVDVIVLAQASMAGAAPLCAHLPTPVLTSPRLGLGAATHHYRAIAGSPN